MEKIRSGGVGSGRKKKRSLTEQQVLDGSGAPHTNRRDEEEIIKDLDSCNKFTELQKDAVKNRIRVELDGTYIDCPVRKEQGKDPLKYRIVNKKKEELVRQLLIEFFIDEYNYPLDRIRSEEPVNIGKEKDEPEAADVVVLDNIGEWYIVGECKAATERVTKKDVK